MLKQLCSRSDATVANFSQSTSSVWIAVAFAEAVCITDVIRLVTDLLIRVMLFSIRLC